MVPHPDTQNMELINVRAVSRTIGLMFPCRSRHENSGSLLVAGTTRKRFCSACRAQSEFCRVRKTHCISPGLAVLADGRSRRAYGLLSRSYPKNASLRFRCTELEKAALVLTVTSPNRMQPQKVHAATAHIQASNGSFRFNIRWSVASICSVTGDLGGFVRRPT